MAKQEDVFVHWIGDAPTSLHGNGAASFDHTTRNATEVTCRLCRTLLIREAESATFHRAEDAEERGAGICRTCLAPIWWETGEIGHQERLDWSDRIKRGGDSIVCFKAVHYRHVPLNGREAAIYDRAYQRGAEECQPANPTPNGDPA